MSEPDARKIDAEVAEKVMGWTRRGYYRDPALENDPFHDIWFDYPNSTYMQDVRAWHPSTNIADAMAVLEKMRELGCGVSLSHIGAMWHVHIFGPEWGDTADDSSIPLAICLCAIKTSKRLDGCALRAVGAERRDCSDDPTTPK